jgi:hypothetical protein
MCSDSPAVRDRVVRTAGMDYRANRNADCKPLPRADLPTRAPFSARPVAIKLRQSATIGMSPQNVR